MSVIDEEPSREPLTHPEEIKAEYELRFGNLASIKASARITPAGVISAGIAAAAIIFAIGFLVSSRAGRRPGKELDAPELRRLRDR